MSERNSSAWWVFIGGVIRWLVILHVLFLGVVFFLLVFVRFFNPPITGIMLYRQWVSRQRVYPMVYLPLKEIPGDIRTMVIALEDDGFYRHHGVEWQAMKRAFERNMKLRKPFYGGSTITQQLARTLFLWPGKSYLRKYLELLIALEMEVVLPKKRILELYLNTAEWGPGVFGIQQGSFYHYRAPVWMLSKDQKMRLLVILSSPVKYGPYDFGRLKILYQRYAYLRAVFGEGD